jgi:hypothetical protein
MLGSSGFYLLRHTFSSVGLHAGDERDIPSSEFMTFLDIGVNYHRGIAEH